MKTKLFTELVIELVGRSSQDFQVDERVVLATTEIVVLNVLRQAQANGVSIPNAYYRSYILPVKYDSVLQRKYIEFDPPVLQFGDNSGIAYVGATLDEYDITSNYVLLKPNQISGMAGLEAQHLGGRPAVRPEGTKGFLYNQPILVDELRVMIIPQISALKETDEMFGLDLSPFGIVEPDYVLRKTLDYIRGKREFREDKNNDGNSN